MASHGVEQSPSEGILPSNSPYRPTENTCNFEKGNNACQSSEISFPEEWQIISGPTSGLSDDELEFDQATPLSLVQSTCPIDLFGFIQQPTWDKAHNITCPGSFSLPETVPGAQEEYLNLDLQSSSSQLQPCFLPFLSKHALSNQDQVVTSGTPLSGNFLHSTAINQQLATFMTSNTTESETSEIFQVPVEKDSNAVDSFRTLFRIPGSSENDLLIQKAVERKYTIGEIISAGLKALDREAATVSASFQPALNPQFIADPYRNNLKLVHYSTIEAYLCNAQALGYSISDILIEGCLSPFHRPEVTQSDDISLYIDITPHLRPTKPQLLHSHNPHLDLIPFPTMRARAITYTSCNPPLIDATQFKIDCVQNQGLTCWAVGDKPSQQPWDLRSWEAAPWFLRKYWMLVGGEEGEVWAQTKWWRRLRGEDL